MNLKKNVLLVLFVLFSNYLFAQINSDSIKSKMKFFEFMEGEWEGKSQVHTQTGIIEVNQYEKVEFKLSGTILNTEGISKNEKDEVVFNAFATIFYDQFTQQFKMHAFKDNGQMTEASIEVIEEGHFIWSFSPNEFTHIKYETEIIKNIWKENGFFSRDGNDWIPIFKMELNRK